MRLVCLSDTHNRTDGLRVPEGDVLLHAGDLTVHGAEEELEHAAAWLAGLPHRHKVVIAGNHDLLFQHEPERARAVLGQVTGCTYLEDTQVTLDGLSIHGTPWQPWFYDWAFNLPRRSAELERVWGLVPTRVDVLLTHSPAHGILDLTQDGTETGCEVLRRELARIQPRLHVFGHIHEAYGALEVAGTRHVNASICDADYRPRNAPVVLDLDPRAAG